jgi:3-oxoacyl-[acyl-carrier protein] reductase
MLLESKNAVIYGGGGKVGGVTRTFACEGARVFLAGRTRSCDQRKEEVCNA